MQLFIELSLIVALATFMAFIMKLLRQPLIVGYIATGILVGPYVFNLIHSHESIELFSKIGISILLFIVGLSLNPDIVREVGKTSAILGSGQVLFTAIVGIFIMQGLGFDTTASIYAAIALTFSSTIIILKLLTDRGDTNKLYGKISIGFLLVQDLIATIILLIVSVLGSSTFEGANSLQAIGTSFLVLIAKGFGIAFAVYIISKFFLPRVASLVANNQEVLFIFSLAWGLGLSALFQKLGFSIEIGALIAGVTFAASPFAYEIGSRMKPLRDFFIILFFILLGAQMVLTQVSALIVPALILSAFVLIGNPLIVYFMMNLLGYRSRTAFMTGLTVAQISEFSLILVALGASVGHINSTIVSLVTLVGIITITGSSYLIIYADGIYKILRRPLLAISPRKHTNAESVQHNEGAEVIIFGYDRVGFDFVRAAMHITEKYMVVDFDPQSIKKLQTAKIPFRYGDAEDIEFLNEINFTNAKLIVSSIPDFKTNLMLARHYRMHNTDGIIIVLAHEIKHTKELYDAGASYVVMPHFLGAHHASELIKKHGFSKDNFMSEQAEHKARIAERESRIVTH